jgi:protein-tyrosine phosphatase
LQLRTIENSYLKIKNERENNEKALNLQNSKFIEMQKLYREKDDEFSKRWTDLKSQISEIQEKIIREKNGENTEMSPENDDFKM